MADKQTKKLSEEENKDRLELFDYVVELLGYKAKNIKPPKQLFLRIEGLRKGEYIPNGKETGICYPYKIILYTFKLMKGQINNALKSVDFKNEGHKINYILIIIEKNINDILIAVEKNKIAKEKMERKVIIMDSTAKNRFQKTEELKSQELFDDDIW